MVKLHKGDGVLLKCEDAEDDREFAKVRAGGHGARLRGPVRPRLSLTRALAS